MESCLDAIENNNDKEKFINISKQLFLNYALKKTLNTTFYE